MNWSYQTDCLSTKLTRAAGMLAKIRYYVSTATLRSIYYGIFSSLLTYGCQVWGQSSNKHISRLQHIQNRAVRIINFANYREPSNPLYYKSNILKFSDFVKLQNFHHVHNALNDNLPVPFNNLFTITTDTQNYYDTRGAAQTTQPSQAAQYKMLLPKVRTQMYGINSATYQSAAAWNTIVSNFPDEKFHLQSKYTCKREITMYLIYRYNQQQ